MPPPHEYSECHLPLNEIPLVRIYDKFTPPSHFSWVSYSASPDIERRGVSSNDFSNKILAPKSVSNQKRDSMLNGNK